MDFKGKTKPTQLLLALTEKRKEVVIKYFKFIRKNSKRSVAKRVLFKILYHRLFVQFLFLIFF